MTHVLVAYASKHGSTEAIAVYGGHWRPEARRFLRRHAQAQGVAGALQVTA